MALLKIARMGHPVLDRPAQPVADPTAPAIRRLVEDMVETMHDAPGIGLAAPQVHVPLRVVVFFLPAGRGGEEVPLTALVNPVIEPLEGEFVSGWEGCLSVPGLRGLVPRYSRIRYTGVTPVGERIDRTVEGMHARVVQHECDHLDGMLYPRRMDDIRSLVFESELRHRMAPADAMMED